MTNQVLILKTDDSPAVMHTLESNEDGEPSFKDVYPLINTNMIEITQGLWVQPGEHGPEGLRGGHVRRDRICLRY